MCLCELCVIEKATDVTQASEDWALYMEICDVINSTEDGYFLTDLSVIYWCVEKAIFNYKEEQNEKYPIFIIRTRITVVKSVCLPFYIN